MITKHNCGKVTWIDIENPTKEDIATIKKEYKIHPIVAEELLSPTLRPKVEHYNEHLYIILHFPTVIKPRGGKTEQEIDFIIGRDFIITVHYQSIKVLNEYAKILDIDRVIGRCSELDIHAGFVFYRIIENIYEKIADQLSIIKKDLKEIEDKIFNGEERKMVEEISETGRKLLDFRIATRPHRDVLESFEKVGKDFFGKDFSFYLGSIVGEYYRIYSMLEGSRETLEELRNTNDSLLNTKSNDIMRTLTILAFVTFPLSLFASLFGMNTRNLPIVGHPQDFWIIIAIMFALVTFFFGIFKYKKWV